MRILPSSSKSSSRIILTFPGEMVCASYATPPMPSAHVFLHRTCEQCGHQDRLCVSITFRFFRFSQSDYVQRNPQLCLFSHVSTAPPTTPPGPRSAPPARSRSRARSKTPTRAGSTRLRTGTISTSLAVSLGFCPNARFGWCSVAGAMDCY